MLASPKPASANSVLSFTDIGGRVASLEAKHTNFKVHVALRLDFDAELNEFGCFPELPWPNNLRVVFEEFGN